MNVAVAFWAARGRPKTMREYALSNRSFSTVVLTMTLFATLMDSNYIGLIGSHAIGFVGLLYLFLFSLSAFVLGWSVYPKLVYFKDKYTLADLMHTMYGPFARLFTVLVSTVFSLLMIIGELKSIGYMAFLVGLSSTTLIISIGIVITFYTAIGGIRSVIATDVLQFIVFAIGLVFFGLAVITQWGGVQTIWENAEQNKPSHTYLLEHPNLRAHFFGAFFGLSFPPFSYRLLLSNVLY